MARLAAAGAKQGAAERAALIDMGLDMEPNNAVTVDEALTGSIGEFGRGQRWMYTVSACSLPERTTVQYSEQTRNESLHHSYLITTSAC